MRQFFLTGLFSCLVLQFAFSQNRDHRPLDLREFPRSAASSKVSSHDDHPQLYTTFTWMDSLSAWDTIVVTTRSYDVNGNLVLEIAYDYLNSTWVPRFRSDFLHTLSGQLIDEHQYQWNGNAWDSTFHYILGYDAMGTPNYLLLRQWNGSAWDTTLGGQSVYTYRNVDQVQSRVKSRWQSLTHAWELIDSTWYGYDNADEWDTVTTFNYAGPGWTPASRNVGYTWYDFSKRLPYTGRMQTYGSGWNDYTRYNATYGPNDSQTWIYETNISSNWNLTGKEVFVFDAKEHQIDYQYYEWIGAWQQTDGELDHYTYDGLGQTVELIRELFDGYLYRYDRRFVYSNFLLATEAPTAISLEVSTFPNPATDQLNFELKDAKPGPVRIQLRDMQGLLRAEIFAPRHDGKIVLTLPNQLPAGIYSYQLRCGEGQATGKCVIRH